MQQIMVIASVLWFGYLSCGVAATVMILEYIQFYEPKK